MEKAASRPTLTINKIQGQRNILKPKQEGVGTTQWTQFLRYLRYHTIILPTDEWKILWDFWIGVLILYSVTAVPFRIGFRIEPDFKGFIFDIIVDIMFGIDMLFTFFTAYEDDCNLYRYHSLIVKNYFKTWFIPDLISTVPFDEIVPAIVSGVTSGTLRSIKLIRVLRLFRLLKLIRVSRLKRKMKEAKVREFFHPIVYELAGLFTKIFLIAHLLACGYYYLSGCHKYQHTDDVWLDCGHLGNLSSMYLTAMYWTTTTLLSIGYGDVYLTTNAGRIFSIFVMFVGSITFGFIVATVSESVKKFDPRETARQLKMEEIRQYLQKKDLSKHLKLSIWKHFDYYYTKFSSFPEEMILDSMPIMLQQLVLEKTRGDLSNYKLFHKEDYGTLSLVLPYLKPTYLELNEVILKEGQYCVDMFFVAHGCLHSTINNNRTSNMKVLVGIYADGSDFGCSYALYCKTISWASYHAIVLTDMMWLGYEEIQSIIAVNDNLKKLFQQRCDEELSTQQHILSSISHLDEIGNLQIPLFILCDGKVIAGKNAMRMIGNVTENKTVLKIYKVVYIRGKDNEGKDLYVEDQETTQQMWSRWVINPHCSAKVYFDLVVGIFALLSSILIPYRIGFGIPYARGWDAFDIVTEILFLIDLILAFFTAYEQSDYVLNTVHKNMTKRYLKTWFLIDFLSTVPFYRLSNTSNSGVLQLLKTLRLGKLIRVLRLFRLARLVKLLRHFRTHSSFLSSDFATLEDGVTRVMKLIFFMGFITHLIACCFSWISLSDHGPTWSDQIGIEKTEYGKKYVAAIYWSYYTMATVGFGDIIPMNDSERFFAMMTMILGTTILAYTVGTVSSYAFNKDSLKGIQEMKLNMIKYYLTEQGIPFSLKDAVMKHYYNTINIHTTSNELKILKKLPHHKRLACISCIQRGHLEKLPLFSKIKESIMTVLYTFFTPCYIVSQTYVYNFETGSGGIYFILKGICEVIDEDEHEQEIMIAEIFPGMFFGHEKLLGFQTDFVGIRSRTNVTMLWLSDKDLETMQLNVPLVYHALISLLQQACLSRGQEISVSRRSIGTEINTMRVGNTIQNSNHSNRVQSYSKRTLSRRKSTVEEFLGWIGDDMDEGTWRQTSNLSHFRKKPIIANDPLMKPSSILSNNSKDRYRALKAEQFSASTKLSSEEFDDESGGVIISGGSNSSKAKSVKSGVYSYVNLYGSKAKVFVEPKRLSRYDSHDREVSEVISDEDEHGPSPKQEKFASKLHSFSEEEDYKQERESYHGRDIGAVSGRSRVPLGVGGPGLDNLSPSSQANPIPDAVKEVSRELFKLTSFDVKTTRFASPDARVMNPLEDGEEEE